MHKIIQPRTTSLISVNSFNCRIMLNGLYLYTSVCYAATDNIYILLYATQLHLSAKPAALAGGGGAGDYCRTGGAALSRRRPAGEPKRLHHQGEMFYCMMIYCMTHSYSVWCAHTYCMTHIYLFNDIYAFFPTYLCALCFFTTCTHSRFSLLLTRFKTCFIYFILSLANV